jgi:hypothetical protein
MNEKKDLPQLRLKFYLLFVPLRYNISKGFSYPVGAFTLILIGEISKPVDLGLSPNLYHILILGRNKGESNIEKIFILRFAFVGFSGLHKFSFGFGPAGKQKKTM